MNPNDCQSCVYNVKKFKDPGYCYWWFTEPDCNCGWFTYKDKRK